MSLEKVDSPDPKESKGWKKLSVSQGIRRASQMYVQNLSIYEKNNLLIKPTAHLKSFKKSMNSLAAPYSGGNTSMQDRIVKKSLKMIRPKNWY